MYDGQVRQHLEVANQTALAISPISPPSLIQTLLPRRLSESTAHIFNTMEKSNNYSACLQVFRTVTHRFAPLHSLSLSLYASFDPYYKVCFPLPEYLVHYHHLIRTVSQNESSHANQDQQRLQSHQPGGFS